MTSQNDFINKTNNAPIYSKIEAPIATSSVAQKVGSTWQKYNKQVNNIVSATNYYGNPSVLLNSDFFWNTAIANPVTQAAGNGAFFSEEWQVQGAAVATYTLTRTTFAGNDPDQVGSSVYVNVAVTTWTGADFYFYQQQDGAPFLRRYQGRNLYLSAKLNNNSTDTFAMHFSVFYFFDPTSTIYTSSALTFPPGINYVSAYLNPSFIGNNAVGGAPYVQFRMEFERIPGGVIDFDLYYIKAEMADYPTPMYVDHALERVRIDNS